MEEKYIRLECQICQKRLRIRPEYVGRKASCKRCGFDFVVPAAEPTWSGNPDASPEPSDRATEPGTVRERLAKKTKQHSAAVSLLWQLNSRYYYAKGQLRDLRTRFVESTEQCQQGEERLKTLEAACSDLANRLENSERLVDRHRQEMDSLSERAARCVEELAETHDQLARSRSEASEARRLLTDRDEELASVKADRDHLETERAALSRTLESSVQNFGSAGDPPDDLKAEGPAKLEAVIRAFEEERGQWEAERLARQGRREEERAEFSRQAELRVLQERERTQGEVDRWRDQLDAMARRLDQEHEDLRRAADQFDREMIPLRQERDAMKSLINSLTQERERITAYRDQLQGSFRQAEQALQEKLAESARALRQVTQEKELAIRRGDEMAGQIRELRANLERSGREQPMAARAQATIPRPAGPANAPSLSDRNPDMPSTARQGTETSPSIDDRDIALGELATEMESIENRSPRSGKSPASAAGNGTRA